MKVSTEDLVAVLRMIAKDLQSPDGVANVFIDGAANRMTLLANLAAKHVEEMEAANDRIKRLEEAGDAVDARLGCGCFCGSCWDCQSASKNWDKAKEAKP
jgi:hypothetical protein